MDENQIGIAQAELPEYQCHKKVHALKIISITLDADLAKSEGRETDGTATIFPENGRYGLIRLSAEYVAKHNPQPGGYYVVYADGYKSYSPASAFEAGYTLIE